MDNQGSTRPKFLAWLLSQPVNRLLVSGFVLVALIPAIFIAATLYNNAWKDAWREINEKHHLLAMNMAEPISIYVEDHGAALRLLADAITELEGTPDAETRKRDLVRLARDRLTGFRALSLVSRQGDILLSSQSDDWIPKHRDAYLNEACFITTRDTGESKLSGVQASPLDGKPTLVLSQPVKTRDGTIESVLISELRISLIEKLRRNIHFGERGHSAIVDQNGRVIAHPNPDWMKSMRDLSHLPVVKAMMGGKTGVTEFYSPFIKQNMVAGYTSVPDIGWGIMVPQPKSEVERQVHALLYPQLAWGLLGLVLAIGVGIALARWITLPLNKLAQHANALAGNDFEGRVPGAAPDAPQEIRQLNQVLSEVINGLQDSREEFDALNRSLHHRVEDATRELSDANLELAQLASRDHLTNLANRRHFENRLTESLGLPASDDQQLCLLLIDVDHFKAINDQHGHAAGDAVLAQVAKILRESTRQEDLVARYGGDEFMVKMHATREISRRRAEQILTKIESNPFVWKGHRIRVTLSMGLYCYSGAELNHDELLLKVDKAMYSAKKSGRNRVVELEEA
jgi:diguanylate cyclase (GGDEF)-like protein